MAFHGACSMHACCPVHSRRQLHRHHAHIHILRHAHDKLDPMSVIPALLMHAWTIQRDGIRANTPEQVPRSLNCPWSSVPFDRARFQYDEASSTM